MTRGFASALPVSLSLVHEDRLTLECWLECFGEHAPEVSIVSAWLLPLQEQDIRGALAHSVLLGASDPRRRQGEIAAIRDSGRAVHVLPGPIQDSLFDPPSPPQPFHMLLLALQHPVERHARPSPPGVAPTARELDIARLFVAGESIAEIGRELAISPNTVQAHLMNLRRRLGGEAVKGRDALGFQLRRRGWLDEAGSLIS